MGRILPRGLKLYLLCAVIGWSKRAFFSCRVPSGIAGLVVMFSGSVVKSIRSQPALREKGETGICFSKESPRSGGRGWGHLCNVARDRILGLVVVDPCEHSLEYSNYLKYQQCYCHIAFEFVVTATFF